MKNFIVWQAQLKQQLKQQYTQLCVFVNYFSIAYRYLLKPCYCRCPAVCFIKVRNVETFCLFINHGVHEVFYRSVIVETRII